MITVGVDVASQPERTAACRLLWAPGSARVQALRAGLSNEGLAELVRDEQITKLGVDVPLGWPDAFVRAVGGHHDLRPWEGSSPRNLTLRATDLWVMEKVKQRPLRVSADRIAYPALRFAAIAGPIDRSGGGRIVEVYPAAALRVWCLPFHGYKREAGREALTSSVSQLRHRAHWLLGDEDVWGRLSGNDDLFDALIAALIARAGAKGLCHPIPPESRELARREGWIAVPREGTLDRLVEGPTHAPV